MSHAKCGLEESFDFGSATDPKPEWPLRRRHLQGKAEKRATQTLVRNEIGHLGILLGAKAKRIAIGQFLHLGCVVSQELFGGCEVG
jgi:hypothetical protein